jgi:hypothetical protein
MLPKKRWSRSIPLDFDTKTSIAVRGHWLLLVAAPPGHRAPGLRWCKHRDRRGADLESEAMAKHTSKRAKTKAEAKVDTGVTSGPAPNGEHEPQRGNRRARSHSVAARTNRAGATGAADPTATLSGTEGVNEEQAPSSPEPIAEHADLGTAGVSVDEQAPASTKRAKLIGMLEQPEGATVAEIGQRLGWLPHTVRAAITGVRKAGREVTRSKDANGRSVYRLVPIKPGSKR